MNLENLDYRPGSHEGEVFVCCPYCVDNGEPTPDTKYKMGVSFNKGIYHCFRCEASGQIAGQESLSYHQSVGVDLTGLKNKLEKIVNRKIQEFRLDLDQFSTKIDKNTTPFGYKYLIDRGLTDQDIKDYQIRTGLSYKDEEGNEITRWAGRIIFPFFEGGLPKFAVGRSYNGKTPKYLNSYGTKSQVVFGIDKIKTEEVIVCEGIISSIAAERITGVSAIATLGKTILPEQLDKLRSRANKMTLVFEGGLSSQEKISLLEPFMNAGLTVQVIDLPLIERDGKKLSDPDDFGEEFLKFYQERKSVNLLNYKELGR